MLDTIVLTLDERHFEVLRPELFSPSAKGLLTPPYYPLGSRGKFACVQNPGKNELLAGHYGPRLTLIKRKARNRFALALKIESSAPKLLFGNNFDELVTHDLGSVLELLHQKLVEMGINIARDILTQAPISSIHDSKNFAFTDYTTCSMVRGELDRIDLTKRLDLCHTDYRNEGHAIRYHANSFELTLLNDWDGQKPEDLIATLAAANASCCNSSAALCSLAQSVLGVLKRASRSALQPSVLAATKTRIERFTVCRPRRFNAFKQIDDALTRFEPLRLEAFRAPLDQGSLSAEPVSRS